MATLSSPLRADARGAGVLGRVAAAVSLGSAAVHLLLLDAGSLGSLVMLGMALICLPCAWHLWRGPTSRTWALTATADVAMLAVHAQLLAPAGAHTAHAHAATGAGGLVLAGLVLVAGQLALAAAAGLGTRSARRR